MTTLSDGERLGAFLTARNAIDQMVELQTKLKAINNGRFDAIVQGQYFEGRLDPERRAALKAMLREQIHEEMSDAAKKLESVEKDLGGWAPRSDVEETRQGG
ncbi:hypothetical protein [Amorphus orientalis]|uniref:Uncharacterized protein n=1 Tax=Amorphus orientalis TaxID=649198 RepID=A0AAE4AUR8_9HYPH|nr:hypothetical protein [Amorphus orientalis]MDQ0317743.1 hypothetical protein [Amorphus orientalis]